MKISKIFMILTFFMYFFDSSYARDFLLGDISNRNIMLVWLKVDRIMEVIPYFT